MDGTIQQVSIERNDIDRDKQQVRPTSSCLQQGPLPFKCKCLATSNGSCFGITSQHRRRRHRGPNHRHRLWNVVVLFAIPRNLGCHHRILVRTRVRCGGARTEKKKWKWAGVFGG